MKKLLKWLKSPKSDFALFVVLLLLANIASYNAFFRVDLTAPKSYSLSNGSKQLVKNLDNPLSVKVFFDDNLPAGYSTVAQYVKDILVEYKGAANKNFSVSYMDMSKNENVTLARSLGLNQIQIQEIKDTEVGFKTGFMGIAITYGDSIEIIDPITSTDGFELKLTSKISKMISMADTLSGLGKSDKILLTLYLSNELKLIGIEGAEYAEEIVKKSFEVINERNQGRLELRIVNPSKDEVIPLVEKYGITGINYRNQQGDAGVAGLGLVLEHGEDFYTMPVQIQNMFFSYAITGLDNLEETITDGLQALLSNITEIGYITGHGEKDITSEAESLYFDNLISGMYELVSLDLNTESIPVGMKSIIINGPVIDFTEEELYKIDQFVMRGGNVMFFVDGLEEQGGNDYYGTSTFVPNSINIDRLLNAYGVSRDLNIVMDKNCYYQNHPQYGKVNLYWVPSLQKNQLARKNILTNNLGYVYMLQNGSLDAEVAKANKNVKTTVLAKSSGESWTVDNNVQLNPLAMYVPTDKAKLKSSDLVVLLEGKFNSAFDEAPAKNDEENQGDGRIVANNHLSSSVSAGKIFVIGSSLVTTSQVINQQGTSPVSMFLMNVVDYMNGNEDLCSMRTKSLSVNTLTIKSIAAVNFWRYFNQYGLVVILAGAGLLVWKARTNRRKQINKRYNPNDDRTISK